MSLSRPNASIATQTRNRTGEEIAPYSGMCVTCIEGCPGLCEVGRSAFRGAEAIYPQPFGSITAAAQKDYPLDFSHLSILGRVTGAWGAEPNPDRATFQRVSTEARLGRDQGILLRMPIVIPALGSTDVARRNWEGLAIGAALAGIPLTVGENVCGMDMEAEFSNGRVKESPALRYRVEVYKNWQLDGYGKIIVQANIEDTRLGVHEYVLGKLGVDAVELKWGQGAKTIGGEVKIDSVEMARALKRRGYLVLPDPMEPYVEEAFGRGAFKEFERHSRIGFVEKEAFIQRVQELRKIGARYVFLKTGAYGPADLARAIRYSSLAGVDVLTIDGAGGGTGMSPWRMMNEWGVPTLYLASLAYRYCKILDERGEYVPDIVLAGGFTLEDHIVKALALGAPYFKAVGMARAPLCAAMVGKTIGRYLEEENIPRSLAQYGRTKDEVFVLAASLRHELGKRFEEVPPAALGVYTYIQRLKQGVQQFLCGLHKFSLEYLDRDDLVSLTRECAEVTGIPYVMEAQMEEAERILLDE